MGDLLKEIHLMFPKAANALKQAGFETDSDIQSLTREDMNELLPGAGDFRLRKDVLDKIQKSSQSTSSEILPHDNKDPPKNKNKSAVMGDLLKEIHLMSEEAADALTKAGFETDSDIRSLTRQDLHELLPGAGDFKLRKDVLDKIQKSRPAIMPLEELGELQKNLASFAQIDPGVFVDHICFIIDLLLNMQQDLKADKDWVKIETTQKSPSPAMDSNSDFDGSHFASRSHGTYKSSGDSNARTSAHKSQKATVKYKMVVGGQTFDAHTQLMDQVNQGTIGVRFLENSQDSQIVIVFCPITSRVESDVKAAMSGVPGDKPVILVKMHHVCESKSSLCLNTLIDDRNNVVQVNVFYHENLRGLLKCELNETAVFEIQQELLKHSDHRSTETRASTSGQGPSSWPKINLPSLPSLPWTSGGKG